MSEHIMITCPTCDLPVRTGFRAAPGSRIDALRQVHLKRCPECQQEHVWDGKDAYWVEYVVAPVGFWRGLRHRLFRSGGRHSHA